MDLPLSDLLGALAHPGHRAIAQHWLALYRRTGNRVPARRDLDPLQFPAALPDIWIVDLCDDGHFRFQLLGQNMIDWHPGNPKGLAFEDIYPPHVLPVVMGMAQRALSQPAISHQKMLSLTRHWSLPIPVERVSLPMTDAAGRIRHLFGATIFTSRDGHGQGVASTEIKLDHWYPVAQAEIRADDALPA